MNNDNSVAVFLVILLAFSILVIFLIFNSSLAKYERGEISLQEYCDNETNHGKARISEIPLKCINYYKINIENDK